MITALFAGMLTLMPVQADTTVSARGVDLLVIQNFSGRLDVKAWDREEILVEPLWGTLGPIEFKEASQGLELRPGRNWRRDKRHDHDDDRRIRVMVPVRLALGVRGGDLVVSVTGTTGGMRIQTGEGDVEVTDVQGDVVIRTGEGEVEVSDVVGQVTVRAGEGTVRVSSVTGDVNVESVDGDLYLRDIHADRVAASTVDGEVEFSGEIRSGGMYELMTHDGDLTLFVDESVNASMRVSTFEGEFRSAIPITLERIRRSQGFEFTLGDGSARVILEAFDGDIRIETRSPTGAR